MFKTPKPNVVDKAKNIADKYVTTPIENDKNFNEQLKNVNLEQANPKLQKEIAMDLLKRNKQILQDSGNSKTITAMSKSNDWTGIQKYIKNLDEEKTEPVDNDEEESREVDENGMDMDFSGIMSHEANKNMNDMMNRNTKAISDMAEKIKQDRMPEDKPEPKKSTGKTFIDYLNEQGIDSSKEHRKAMAEKLGIKNYDFSAEKNMELWRRIKDADPLEFKNTEVSDEQKEKQIKEANAKKGLF